MDEIEAQTGEIEARTDEISLEPSQSAEARKHINRACASADSAGFPAILLDTVLDKFNQAHVSV